MKIPLTISLILVLLVGIGGFLFLINSSNQGTGVSIGDHALDINFITTEGSGFRLSDQRGRVVVVDFMTTTCSVCLDEFKVLNQFEKDQRATFVSVNLDASSQSALKAFAASYGLTWIVGSSQSSGVDYKVSSVPTLLVIDKEGVIRYRGNLTSFDQLNQLIGKYS